MKIDEYIRKLESFGTEYKTEQSLSEYCSYKTGGVARVVVFPKTEMQLKAAIDEGIDYCLIGCGTNVLFSDYGYDGAIIVTTGMKKIECSGSTIIAQCGASLSDVRETAAMNSLGGLEFTEGIPATIGGAICMNAGCFSKSIGDYVSYVVTGDGVINAADCRFGYRTSVFCHDDSHADNTNGTTGVSEDLGVGKNDAGEACSLDGRGSTDSVSKAGRVIISACFLLKPGEPDVIEAKRERFRKLRKNAQPHGRSCGSVFLNDGYFAGKVIDSAGLKGFSVGGAKVSEKHANFILAGKGATSSDIYGLIKEIKRRVYREQGIVLKEEIRYIGKFDD